MHLHLTHLIQIVYSLSFWYRECAVKFNDYFEFPREIDMEPFTEDGLAKRQGTTPT